MARIGRKWKALFPLKLGFALFGERLGRPCILRANTASYSCSYEECFGFVIPRCRECLQIPLPRGDRWAALDLRDLTRPLANAGHGQDVPDEAECVASAAVR